MMEQKLALDYRREVKLSPRQLDVLALVAKGHTNQSAAEVLVVSKRTVDFHLRGIYQKLGVNNRLRAVTKAGSLGILPFEGRI